MTSVVFDFYKEINKKYSDISGDTDIEYERLWGEIDEFGLHPYSWFESLAHALN
ncbi:MAG: hypothetical protein HWE27_14010 [Gammaproteobacteria bacterium]|nr:hypothetical protein [Gammaproteobacteria bacterium]